MEKTVELGTVINPAKTVRCRDSNYPVLSMTMHNGLVFQDEKFKKVIASKDTSDYKVVFRNQLVISFPIDEGVLAAQRIADAGIVSPAYGIWDIDQSLVLPEFLEYALRCNRAIQYYKAKLRGSTARRRSLPTPTLLAFRIPLPSIDEQAIILDRINKVKAVIEKRSTQIQKLDDLIKARFVEMFGDPLSVTKEKKKLSDIGRIYTGNTPSMKNPEYYDSEDIPFVKPGDIAESGVSLIKQVDSFISEKARNVARIIPQDAVLVTCIGTIGKIGIAAKECCCNQQINYIVLDADVDSVYLAYCISFFKDVLADMANAPVVPIINKTQFSTLEIPVAEYGKQIQFSRFVQQVDKSKAVVQKALDETQVLFDSLMQQYFG